MGGIWPPKFAKKGQQKIAKLKIQPQLTGYVHVAYSELLVTLKPL